MLKRGLFIFGGFRSAFFICLESDLYVSQNCPVRVLLIEGEKWDNKIMEELIKRLEKIGFTSDTCASIRKRFDGDLAELKSYVLFCVALFDDRHEYMD